MKRCKGQERFRLRAPHFGGPVIPHSVVSCRICSFYIKFHRRAQFKPYSVPFDVFYSNFKYSHTILTRSVKNRLNCVGLEGSWGAFSDGLEFFRIAGSSRKKRDFPRLFVQPAVPRLDFRRSSKNMDNPSNFSSFFLFFRMI